MMGSGALQIKYQGKSHENEQTKEEWQEYKRSHAEHGILLGEVE
jgi:hypothetical protein